VHGKTSSGPGRRIIGTWYEQGGMVNEELKMKNEKFKTGMDAEKGVMDSLISDQRSRIFDF
jgi:hypothetical protein